MSRVLISRWRAGAAVVALGAVLAAALIVPVPAVADPDRATVRQTVRERLPGWRIERLVSSWEGAYTVVASCEAQRIGFQLIPGHGLGPDDAWLHPSDAYARERLEAVSDHYRSLIWYGERRYHRSLSCLQELARLGVTPSVRVIVH